MMICRRHSLTLAAMLGSVALAAPAIFAAEEQFPAEESVAGALAAELTDADERRQPLRDVQGKRGTVLVFLSTECPISNGYVPALNRLHQEFHPQGIALVGINSNETQTRDDISAHVKKFDIRFPVLRDDGAAVADKLGIDVCPMVLVLDERQQPVYQGRIDDRYVRRGGGARGARRADLELALGELIAGKPISVSLTEPIGCPLIKRVEREAEKTTFAEITYSEHISRLMQRHCQECHRPDGVGPFSLLTYDEAASWADDIKTFTANRTMPPWLPKSGHDKLANARVLTEDEIGQIAVWVDGGKPEGDPKLLPEPKTFHDGWQLGEPDIILTPSDVYTLEAEGKDEYRCFVLPTNCEEDVYVKAIEVLPGARAVVHHVLVFLDSSGRAAALDAKDPLSGYATTAGFPGFLPSGGLGGWAPGNTPDFLPDGTARLLPKGATVVMQVHYHKTGKAEQDQTRLGLHLAKEPINRLTRGLMILPYGIPFRMRIPAGAERHEVRGGLELTKDVLLLGVTPHMHLLGQDMHVTATLPDGSTETLIDTRWNFNWQESYQLRTPLLLPQGTQLEMTAHFDNSESNPYNPHQPPQTVKWGEQTNDEMCIAFLEVTTPHPARSPDELKPINPREEMRDALLSRLKSEHHKRMKNSPLRHLLP